jgi:hypothetical protein
VRDEWTYTTLTPHVMVFSPTEWTYLFGTYIPDEETADA